LTSYIDLQGLKKNIFQFSILVLVNAFVGAMVGLERSIFPEFAQAKFHIQAHTALLTFIAAFGISKSLSNLLISKISHIRTRKEILIIGWLFALPVPFLLMYASDWGMIILANILLGINQGLAWSSTVIMKIDLAGNKDRGLAMGLNEFAGYLSVGLAAYLAGYLAQAYGLSYYPFLPGIFFAAAGLLLSIFVVKDTTHFVQKESVESRIPLLKNLWQEVSWKHQNIGSVTLNGWMNNLNDGVLWGLVPLWLIERQVPLSQVAWITAVYPAVWGLAQLFTGRWGDTHCKKQIISLGMWVQSIGMLALIAFAMFSSGHSFQFAGLLFSAFLLGIGTAMVYPNFLSTVADNSHPSQRAQTLSIFRFWRDSGYVFGALLAGMLADAFGIPSTLVVVALLTAGAGVVANIRMCCTNKQLWLGRECVENF
jgi:MFS family permease